MEIMTREEFWARSPMPGTQYVELDSINKITGRTIDYESQDPDDILAITFGEEEQLEDSVIVIKWGSWEDHSELLELHKLAVDSMLKEGTKHVCEIGL